MTAEVCVSCEEAIRHTPVYFDGDAYCCAGCVAGGPCRCDYTPTSEDQPPTATRAPQIAPTQPPSQVSHPRHQEAIQVDRYAYATQPSTPPPPEHPSFAPRGATPAPQPAEDARTPIPFRRPGARTIVLHARGFREQAELLRFAALVERAGAFSEVALTRVTATEAWFTLSALSADDVQETLARFEGFEVQVRADQNLVEVDVHASAPAPRTMNEPVNEGETLLPPRPRFRVFRAPDPSAQPAPPPAQDAPFPSHTVREAAAPYMPSPVPRPAPREETPPAAPVPAPQPAAQATPPPGPPASAVPPSAPSAPEVRRPPAAPAPGVGNLSATGHPVSAPAPGAPPARAAAPRPASPPPQQAQPRYEYEDDDLVVEPEERPGGAVGTVEHLTLVVYPFHSFAALNDFQAAVRTLHGVTNTRVRRFYRGTLHLAVDYEDMIPLGERIRDLKAFNFEVASESRSEIELVLEDSGSLVAAGDK